MLTTSRAVFAALAFVLALGVNAGTITPQIGGGIGGFDGGVGFAPVTFTGQLNLNLANNSGNVAPATALTETRAGVANVPNSTGGLSSIAANTLRLGADEIFNQPAGAWIEEAATNSALSSDLAGCVAGVLGSGGALPTGWTRSVLDGSGLTVTIGCAPFTLRFSGTANPGAFGLIETNAITAVAVTPGDTWTGSLMVQQIAGTLTNVSSIGPYILEYVSGSFSTFASQAILTPNTDIPWFAQTSAPIAASITTATLAFGFGTSAGAVDVTFAISRPMFAKQAYRSTLATSSRNADQISLASSFQTAYTGASSRSVCLQFDAPRFKSAATLWSEQGTAGNFIELRLAGSNGASTLSLFVSSGGVTTANVVLAVLAPLSRNLVCMSISPTAIITSVMGKAAVTTALTPPAVSSTLLGSGNNGFLNSTVQKLQTWLVARTAAQVQADSSDSNDLFDDFDRADNASLGAAPTGQVWSQTNLSTTATFSIASKFMVPSSVNAGAIYAYTALSRNPVYMGSAYTMANQTNGASVGEIAASGSPVNPFLGTANHEVFTTTGALFEYISAGSINLVAQYNYTAAQVTDGATLYGHAWGQRNFDNSVVQIQHTGDLIRLVSSLITGNIGPVLWYESFAAVDASTVASIRTTAAR